MIQHTDQPYCCLWTVSSGNSPDDTQSFTVTYPNIFLDWISVNRKSSLLEGLGVKVGIYCARRLIKHVEVFAKLLWKATVSFFCVNNQQDALYRLIYYSKSVLHVSDDVFAHYREHLTIFTVSGTVHPRCCRLVSWMSWNCFESCWLFS